MTQSGYDAPLKVRGIPMFFVGAVGATIMTLVMLVGRTTDVSEFEYEMFLGSLITGEVRSPSFALGYVVHIIAGGIAAILYAAIFKAWGGAGWLRGLILGAGHAVLMGFLLIVITSFHPMVPEAMPAPGFLGIDYGWITALTFAILHLVFGAFVGEGCRAIARRPVTHAGAVTGRSVEP